MCAEVFVRTFPSPDPATAGPVTGPPALAARPVQLHRQPAEPGTRMGGPWRACVHSPRPARRGRASRGGTPDTAPDRTEWVPTTARPAGPAGRTAASRPQRSSRRPLARVAKLRSRIQVVAVHGAGVRGSGRIQRRVAVAREVPRVPVRRRPGREPQPFIDRDLTRAARERQPAPAKPWPVPPAPMTMQHRADLGSFHRAHLRPGAECGGRAMRYGLMTRAGEAPTAAPSSGP